MKATFAIAATAALAGGVSAASVHNRHLHHAELFERKADNATCVAGCTTIYSTWYGEPTLYSPPAPSSTVKPTTAAAPSTTAKPTTAKPTTAPVVVPTPVAQTCPTPGVYSFPATTVTLTETTTVVAISTTPVPVGTHTLGGVTTVVETATTVVCPYATPETSGGVVTNVIKTTTYVCPSAGTYTIGPHTTTVATPATVPVPVLTTYPPGTYTQPAVVTTIVVPSTVIYCPFDQPTSAPAPPPAPVPVTTYPAVPPPAATSTAATAPPAKPSTSPPVSSPPLGGSGDKYAITYTPYTSEGLCKGADDVMKDIKKIKNAGFSTIRVYSTDCDTLPNVGGAADAAGLKLILGIFIDSPGCHASHPTIAEQIDAIKSWARWDLVELITVGNEAIIAGHCTAPQLAGVISSCKSAFGGYSGPFTTAETVNVWQEPEVANALCPLMDIVGANAHAFFNTQTTASQAGPFVKGQLDIVSNICPGKSGIILETGWPSAGNCMGSACPGVSEQASAIASIKESVGKNVVFFSFINDAWKSGSTECGCEQFWGCGKLFGLA